MKPSEYKISIQVESYDEKTAENCRNGYVAAERIVSKLQEILIPNLIAQIKDLIQDFCQNFTSLSLMLSEI